MNIESLKVSKTMDSHSTSYKAASHDKNFSKILSKANRSISKSDQTTSTSQNNISDSITAKKQNVEKVDPQEIQTDKSVEDTEDSKESKETSSRFRFNYSNGLEGLLGSVSKLVDNSEQEQTTSIDDFSAILNASSLEQLGDALGLDLKESDYLEGPSLDNILQTLGIDKNDLQQAIQQLTGDNHSTAEDIWSMLANIDQNNLTFKQNLLSTINGDSNAKISKQQATQVLQVLKLIELTAPKTDLMLKQEYQTFQLKEMLSQLSTKVEQSQSNEETNLVKYDKVQQLNVNLLDTDSKVVDTNTKESISAIQTINKENTTTVAITPTNKATTTSITISLPTNKASQAEAFVKEFQAIMNRSQFSNNAAGTKLLIKLYPENLGSVRVELIQKDGVMSARFLASTNIGKQMLESQLQQLKQGLVNQNIQLDRIDVAQALTETNRADKEHQHQFQQAFKQHSEEQEKKQKDNDDDDSSFNDILMDLEV